MSEPSERKTKRLGRYLLKEKLGAGGMGTVYKAFDTQLERPIALKLLSSKLAKRQVVVDRFMREGRMAGALTHSNIVQALEVGQEGKYYFLAMEYVEGVTLKQALKRGGPFSEQEIIDIAMEVTLALQHAAGKNIVHRDLKPENIMLTEEDRIKILDMGLAKTIDDDSTLTQAGRMIGTPSYSSPEQIRGETDIDGRTDIYSLGQTMFHLVTGRRAFDGETAGIIVNKQLNEPMPDPMADRPDLSPEFCAVVLKMTEKEPDKRYQTPSDLLEDLECLRNGAPLKHASGPASKRVKSSGLGMYGVLGGAAAAVILVCVYMMQTPTPPVSPSPEIAGTAASNEKPPVDSTGTTTVNPETIAIPPPPPSAGSVPENQPMPILPKPVDSGNETAQVPAPSSGPSPSTTAPVVKSSVAPTESPEEVANSVTQNVVATAPVESPTSKPSPGGDIFADVAAYKEIQDTLVSDVKEREFLRASSYAIDLRKKASTKRFHPFLDKMQSDIPKIIEFVNRGKEAFKSLKGENYSWSGLPSRIIEVTDEKVIIEMAGRVRDYPFAKVRISNLAQAMGVDLDNPSPADAYIIGITYMAEGQKSQAHKYWEKAVALPVEEYIAYASFEAEYQAGEHMLSVKNTREAEDFRTLANLIKEAEDRFENSESFIASTALLEDARSFVREKLEEDQDRAEAVARRIRAHAAELGQAFQTEKNERDAKISDARAQDQYSPYSYSLDYASSTSVDGFTYSQDVTVNGVTMTVQKLARRNRRILKESLMQQLQGYLEGHKKTLMLESKSRRLADREYKRLKSEVSRAKSNYDGLESKSSRELDSRLKTLETRSDRLQSKVQDGADPSDEQILDYLKNGR